MSSAVVLGPAPQGPVSAPQGAAPGPVSHPMLVLAPQPIPARFAAGPGTSLPVPEPRAVPTPHSLSGLRIPAPEAIAPRSCKGEWCWQGLALTLALQSALFKIVVLCSPVTCCCEGNGIWVKALLSRAPV